MKKSVVAFLAIAGLAGSALAQTGSVSYAFRADRTFVDTANPTITIYLQARVTATGMPQGASVFELQQFRGRIYTSESIGNALLRRGQLSAAEADLNTYGAGNQAGAAQQTPGAPALNDTDLAKVNAAGVVNGAGTLFFAQTGMLQPWRRAFNGAAARNNNASTAGANGGAPVATPAGTSHTITSGTGAGNVGMADISGTDFSASLGTQITPQADWASGAFIDLFKFTITVVNFTNHAATVNWGNGGTANGPTGVNLAQSWVMADDSGNLTSNLPLTQANTTVAGLTFDVRAPQPTNRPPVANDDSMNINLSNVFANGTQFVLSLAGLVSDPDGDPLALALVSETLPWGTVAVVGTNLVVTVTDANARFDPANYGIFAAVYSATETANSGGPLLSDNGTITLNIVPTPGAMALLGLGGLAAGRRRRA